MGRNYISREYLKHDSVTFGINGNNWVKFCLEGKIYIIKGAYRGKEFRHEMSMQMLAQKKFASYKQAFRLNQGIGA